LFSYLGLLMLAAIVLAFLTRKVVSVFNESRYIGLIIYSAFFIGGVCLVLSFVLESIVEAAYAISCGGIIFCCTITLVALFFPKFYLIFFRRVRKRACLCADVLWFARRCVGSSVCVYALDMVCQQTRYSLNSSLSHSLPLSFPATTIHSHSLSCHPVCM
jgi:7TM sweet-taste receptor of 3 GCPR